MNETKILDGATGTLLWAKAEKAGLEKYATWRYNVDHPQFLAQIAKEYHMAGSDIVYSNTFVATRMTVGETGYKLRDVIASAIKAVQDEGVCCAYSLGPLEKIMEPYGTLTEQECSDNFREAIEIACDYSPDLIVLETFQDINMLKIAAEIAAESKLPVICSMSFDKGGKSLFGTSPASMVEELSALKPAAVGMNCSLGPKAAVGIIDEFAASTSLPLLVKPNSQDLPPEEFAKALEPVFSKVSYIGSCCGSNPDYIRALKDRIKG